MEDLINVPTHMSPVRILHFDTPEGWRLLQTEPSSMPTPRMPATAAVDAAETAWDDAVAAARQTTPMMAETVATAAAPPTAPTSSPPTAPAAAPTAAPTTAPESVFMAHDISRATDADLTSLRQAARVFIDRLETEQHIRRRRGTSHSRVLEYLSLWIDEFTPTDTRAPTSHAVALHPRRN